MPRQSNFGAPSEHGLQPQPESIQKRLAWPSIFLAAAAASPPQAPPVHNACSRNRCNAGGLAEHLPRHGAVAALALSALTRAGSLRLIKVDCRDTNRILGPFSALAKNDSTCDHKRLVVASLFRNVSDLLQDTAKDNDFRNMTSEVEETR